MEITISQLESYLEDRYGSWAKEHNLFMKLVEEIGEVAEVLNKRSGAKAAGAEDLQEELAKELADVIHYAVAIASVNDLDLNGIILAKDQKASLKYNRNINLAQFVLQERKSQ